MPKRTSIQDKNSSQVVTQSRPCLDQKRILNSKEVRQKAFLQAYTASGFNISDACRTIGANRKIYYYWLKTDPAFVDNLQQAQDEKNEIIESALFEKAKKGDVISMIFWLKSKAKWVDTPTKQQIEISQAPKFDQSQLDAMVRGQIKDRTKYENMLGFPDT